MGELDRKKEANRKMILKALIDPEFRKMLEERPAEALNMRKLTEVNKQEIRLVLAAVKGISLHIAAAGDELLCANGPCGIA